MIDLKGKVAVVFGLANKRSIAWGIAQKLSEAGASLAICYQNERLQRDAEELAGELPNAKTFRCDVALDADIDACLRAAEDDLRQAGYPGALDRLRAEHQEHRAADGSRGLPRGARHQRVLADRACPRRGTADGGGRLDPHADLLRLGEGLPELQHHGRGQGCARGHGAVSGGGSGREEDSRECHLRGPDQDACRTRHRRLHEDPERGGRACAAASQRGCARGRQHGAVPLVAIWPAASPARSPSWTAATTSSACNLGLERAVAPSRREDGIAAASLLSRLSRTTASARSCRVRPLRPSSRRRPW